MPWRSWNVPPTRQTAVDGFRESILLGREFGQVGNQAARRACSMTYGPLHRLSKLRERSMVLDDFEQRVVAESRVSSRLASQPSMALRFMRNANVSLRIGKRDVANVIRAALIVGNIGHFAQQPRIVLLVTRIGTSVARGIDAWSAAERRHA